MQKERENQILDCQKFLSWKSPGEVEDICSNTNWRKVNKQIGSKMTFLHVNFGDITDDPLNAPLKRQLNNIATDFRLDSHTDDATGLTAQQAIECAVPLLFGHDNECGGKKYTSSDEVRNKWKEIRNVLMQ